MESVDADIADAPAFARSCGIDPPFGLLALDRPGQPALRIFDHDLADGANSTGSNPRLHLAHQRIARIGVGQAIGETGGRNQTGQLLRLAESRGHGLVAHHRQAGREGSAHRRQVMVIGADHRDEVDAVIARPFGSEHRLQAAISPRRIDPIGDAGGATAARIGRKDARDQFDLAVEFGCDAMDRTDERAGSTPDHAHPQAPHRHLPRTFYL